MDWYPNDDAMLWFAGEVLPRLQRTVANVSLEIIGRNPSARVQALQTVAISVTGTVDDVRPFIDAGAVYVVPLRVGGGTRLKIFEALAMGKAVVSTTVGAEGLDVVDGTHLIIADGPEAFSNAVAELLGNPERRRALGEAGRRLVEERYSWASVTKVFETELAHAAIGRTE
jgi:glycosyltransferase involved in cell wall biosynthesis